MALACGDWQPPAGRAMSCPMTRWRPQDRIRVKALGLHWRDGRLLAAEVTGDSGAIKGYRPLGGSVEFGETARSAVIREFREELGIGISVISATELPSLSFSS